ncbi:hypothetical protein [Ruania alba]|nr:hypothetical protein [Ruania alba]
MSALTIRTTIRANERAAAIVLTEGQCEALGPAQKNGSSQLRV